MWVITNPNRKILPNVGSPEASVDHPGRTNNKMWAIT